MRVRSAMATIILASSVAACGSPGPMSLDGMTILRHEVMTASPAALFTGTVHFRDGCVWGDASGESQVIIWPPTARLDHLDGRLVLVVGDFTLHDGDDLSIGGGQYSDAATIPSFAGPIPDQCRADLYWLGTDIIP